MRETSLKVSLRLLAALSVFTLAPASQAQIAVRGKMVHTMSGPAIADGVVIISDGKISQIGPSSRVAVPQGMRMVEAAVVTPGLIDAHCTVGVSGVYNQTQDQDQLDRSSPIQPELRALDAYNPLDALVEWVRNFGITTIHTGHAPGELVSGQTFVVKTAGTTVDDARVRDAVAVAATISPSALKHKGKGKSPGTRGKMMAMLRAEFIKAGEYLRKLQDAKEDKKPDRNLRLEALGRVLNKELPLLVTANRAQDIAGALRIAAEFDIPLILDSAAEAYLLVDEIKKAGVPVIVHPSMSRAAGEMKNMSFETAARLRHAGIPIALQGGYESYVPKVRVVLFEAAVAAANGLSWDEAMASITVDAASILGVSDRIGSLEVGKDGDVALFDGDPFEYTTHCVGVIIDGKLVSDKPH